MMQGKLCGLTRVANTVCDDRGIRLNRDMEQWLSPQGNESIKTEDMERRVFLFMHRAWRRARSCF